VLCVCVKKGRFVSEKVKQDDKKEPSPLQFFPLNSTRTSEKNDTPECW
jgi:hypothetical protein